MKFRWILLAFIGLIGLYLIFTCTDERLSALSTELLTPDPEVLTDDENGFLTYATINAPSGVDPKSWLTECLARYVENNKANLSQSEASQFQPKPVESPFDIHLIEDQDSSLSKRKRNLQELLSIPSDQLETFVHTNKRFLDKYLLLIQSKGFEEPIADTDFVWVDGVFHSGLSDLHRLFEAHIATLYLRGEYSDACGLLMENLNFWRSSYGTSRCFIGKQFMGASLGHSIRFVSSCLDDPDFSAHLAPTVIDSWKPLTAKEKSWHHAWKQVFSKDFHFVKHFYSTGGLIAKTIFKLSYHTNRTANSVAPLFHALSAELDPMDLDQILSFNPDDYLPAQAFDEEGFRFFSLLQNPAGKMVSHVTLPMRDFKKPYILNIEVDACLRLLGLKARALQKNISPERMVKFLQESGGDLYDPISGKPMLWNSEEGKISCSELSPEIREKLGYFATPEIKFGAPGERR